MMAEKTCTRAQDQAPSCQVAWLQRRQALEDMPTARVDAGDCQTAESGGGCCCHWREAEALLTCQNKLLFDILGALNALTAAYLAQQKG